MDKTFKIFLIVAVCIALVGYWLLKDKPAFNPTGEGRGTLLKMGIEGQSVKNLQIRLNQQWTIAKGVGTVIGWFVSPGVYQPITQPIIANGEFTQSTQDMLYSITGKKEIYESEINTIKVNPFTQMETHIVQPTR